VTDVKIRVTSPDDEAARALVAQLDAGLLALYPAESNHLENPQDLQRPNVLVLGAFMGASMVGIGAVKRFPDYGEIKRLYVADSARGSGVAQLIMQHLEQHLRDRGITVARLETGIHQSAALGLYRRLGYVGISAFGDYADDPLSVFMQKRLTKNRLPGHRPPGT